MDIFGAILAQLDFVDMVAATLELRNGTTFYVTLPNYGETALAATGPVAAAAEADAWFTAAGHKRITSWNRVDPGRGWCIVAI